MKVSENYYETKNKLLLKFIKDNSIDGDIDDFLYKADNDGILGVEYTKNDNDLVNGVILEIEKKDYETYSKREHKYDLVEVEYIEINPSNGLPTGKKGKVYLNVPKIQFTETKKVFPNKLYHKNSKKGAYNFGTYFGKMFEETTYLNDGNLVDT